MTDVLRVALVTLVTATACTGGGSDRTDARSFQEIACSLPPGELVRVARGYHPQRSGQVQFVLREPNFMALTRSHSGPWGYLQRVPMFFYGPGHVPEVGPIDVPATMVDVAPTLSRHLRFGYHTTDGEVLEQAVEPGAAAPKLIMVVVWDGAGRNVLSRYPDAWPTLKGLTRHGAWFERAVVGTSPTVTPAVHATLGTGTYPRTHGIVDFKFQVHGSFVDPQTVGPRHLLTPSLADRYDLARNNLPLIGEVARDEWNMTMVGQGARYPGGDRDMVTMWDEDLDGGWQLTGPEASSFAFPTYLDELPGLEDEVRRLDLEDGLLDGMWLGDNELDSPDEILRSPAYARYQTRSLEEMITREGFGDDQVPDLLFTNYKQIDRVAHVQGMESPEMEEVIRSSDQALGDLIDILNREVGEGEWVLALTADHGATPPPSETGAFVITPERLRDDIRATFDDRDGRGVLDAVRFTQMWLDTAELRDNGYSVAHVIQYLMRYTKGRHGEGVPEDRRDDRLFAAAFRSSLMKSLPCLR
jgi:predicted AlkP superfamily pyrophosphatase or phosphodiesterase